MKDFWQELPAQLPTAEEMARCDAATIAAGIPSQTLMERAGAAVVDHIQRQYGPILDLSPPLILCGPGNNGGDGLVIGRLLASYTPQVLITSATSYSEDHSIQCEKLKTSGIMPQWYGGNSSDDAFGCSDEQLIDYLRNSLLVIDCLLGTGQEDAPRGCVKELLDVLSSSDLFEAKDRVYLSVDVPCGINATTGEVFEPVFRASETICIEAVKRGLLQFPARSHAGRIHAVSIGIDVQDTETRMLSPQQLRVPKRADDIHKYDAGSVLVIGGSSAMPGASTLVSRACIRSGAGLVYKACLSSMDSYPEWPELMLAHCKRNDVYSQEWFDSLTLSATCIVLGPGLQDSVETDSFIEYLLKQYQGYLVIDATGLRSLARLIEQERVQKKHMQHAVLTPHPGEAASLLSCKSALVQKDRYSAAAALVDRTGAHVILKGAATIIAADSFPQSVLPYGNPFMATAGSGDVLSGILGARIAQGEQSLYDASCTSALIHALAADAVHARSGGPLIASDIISQLPETIGKLYREQIYG